MATKKIVEDRLVRRAQKSAGKAEVIPLRGRAKGTIANLIVDTAKVPAQSAPLSERLAFAAAYLQRALDGQPASPNTLLRCCRWIAEGARALA